MIIKITLTQYMGKSGERLVLGRRFTYIFSVGYFDKFRKLDLRIEENKKRLIDGLVKAIIVYDDHFEVFLTFDDSPITIPTSEEIESMKNSSDIASVTSLDKQKPNALFFAGIAFGQTTKHRVE